MSNTRDTTDEDIAILHDQWTELGGAEHVAIEMARTFDAPIYAGAVDEAKVPDDVDVRVAFTRWWEQKAMQRHHLVQDFCQMFAWQHVDEVYDYDTVILNKNNPGWFVPADNQTVVKYCHTTPRQPYDLFPEHGDHYFSRLLKTPMRILYRPNITYPDAWACNSELVQHRISKYWGQEGAEVIYPPVSVDSYSRHLGTDRDYYLTLSRLAGHKNIEQIVHAFNRLGEDYQLRIAGDGPARDHLERIANDNVELLGYVDEETKRRLLSEAKAFVFAAENEDFGMVPVEAMASGTPVIGVEDGFTQHQIIDGKNGRLFADEAGHLREQIRYFDRHGVTWSAERIEAFVDRFRAGRFREEIRALVRSAQSETRVETPWEEEEEAGHTRTREQVLSDGGESQ